MLLVLPPGVRLSDYEWEPAPPRKTRAQADRERNAQLEREAIEALYRSLLDQQLPAGLQRRDRKVRRLAARAAKRAFERGRA